MNIGSEKCEKIKKDQQRIENLINIKLNFIPSKIPLIIFIFFRRKSPIVLSEL